MSRERFCKVCAGWHPLDKPWPHNCRAEDWTQRSELPAPMLIRDGMEAVQSMLDGKMYDSKRALRATYRQAGVVEVGNEEMKPAPKPKPDRAKIKEAVGKAFSRAGLGA